MIFYATDQWEDIINQASKTDERTEIDWSECAGDPEYRTLCEFFDRENYPHYNDYEEWVEVNTDKRLKEILKGTDRIKLIRFAFVLGQIVGRASHVVELEN